MNRDGQYYNPVILYIDLLLLKQAEKFVATTDLSYVAMLRSLPEYSKEEVEIKENIFALLSAKGNDML